MHTLVYPFTTQDIIVTSADNLSNREWEEVSTKIGELITKILLTLHPAEPNSPITKLHESGVGFPVSANDVLWEFLKTSEYYHQLSQGRLNILSETESDSVIDFDPAEMTISRNTDVKIRAHVIMSEFTIDKIDQLLSKYLSNYLVAGPHTYLVRGKEQWEISFLHPDTELDIDMIVSEGSAVICYPNTRSLESQQKTQTSPFSHSFTSTPISAAIIESSNPLYSKAIGELIFDMQATYQFNQFVEEWKCGATILFSDGAIEQYSI